MIRLEFPAQGYVNPANTTIEFDVILKSWDTRGGSITRFQNNIQSLFSRVRLMYGSTPIEDIINYNQIVRSLTEWTGSCQNGVLDQSSIADGIGGIVSGHEGTRENAPSVNRQGLVNIRQAYIQGIDQSRNATNDDTAIADVGDAIVNLDNGNGYQFVPNNKAFDSFTNTSTRRYQVNLALGLFTQEKLIPTKFMASQLAIEITLENEDGCIVTFAPTSTGGTLAAGNPPTYRVANVNLIPEILEFDASYGKSFILGVFQA